MNEEDNNKNSFSFLYDPIRLSLDIKLLSWSPTMDLLAFLTFDNILYIYRIFPWQKLITISKEDNSITIERGKITCLFWHPEGIYLLIYFFF